jgi:hypothetical protein
MLGSLYSSFLGGKSTEKERKQKPEEMENIRVIIIKKDLDYEFFNNAIKEILKIQIRKLNGLLTKESKIENNTHESALKRIQEESKLKMARYKKELELETERINSRYKLEIEKIENERKKMMQFLDNIMKGIYDKNKYEIDYDNGNVRDIKLKIKDLVKKREMNEKEIGSKKGKIGHFEKKTKLDIRKYKSQLKYKYKNDGIEFLRKYRKIEKEIELRDQRSENEKLNLQKEIKGNDSNGDKENKELNIKIVPKEEQLNTQNLQIVLKNIIKNFLLQLKDKHSRDLGKNDNDANTTMNQGKNKIKMIDKVNFNKDESLHNADAGTSVIARHDSKIPFPFQVNQSNNDNQLNSIMQRNNTFNYYNQTSKMDQNLNNESKFINISMNMKVNQKINDLYKYNPKY